MKTSIGSDSLASPPLLWQLGDLQTHVRERTEKDKRRTVIQSEVFLSTQASAIPEVSEW